MAAVVSRLSDLIGNTPMLRLDRYAREQGIDGSGSSASSGSSDASANGGNSGGATIVAKLEYLNPAGSIKDRVALAMIEDAEKSGKLKPGGTIIEPTSGSTGIGLACAGVSRGYRVVLTMPESMSAERRKLLLAYGAELVLTDGAAGIPGAVAKAEELLAQTPGAFMPGQFGNPVNPQTHRATTGPEIWDATGGSGGALDFFVAGVGTGGTLTGAGGFLKEMNPALKVVAVEPANSPVLSGGRAGPHNLQGIGAGFIPKILDTSVYDEVIAVSEEDAYRTARAIARTEGLLVGISSGAAVWAATQIALRPENARATIAVILPDSGERYLSTPAFD